MKKLFAIFICLSISILSISAALAQGPEGDWVSSISCQNLDQSNAAEITLTFYSNVDGSIAAIYNDTITAGSSRNYDTTDAALNVPVDFSGSVVVSSLKPVVCTVNTQKSGSGTSEDPYRIASSSGLDELEVASTIYAPQIMKTYFGWSSYLSVQNASDSPVTIQITYKNREGNDIADATESATIPSHSNALFYQTANEGLTDAFIGAAKVSVTSPVEGEIAAVVHFYNVGDDASTSQFHSYNGLSGGATKLYLPRVVRLFYGYNSGVTIQNISDVATTVTITFNFDENTYVYNSDTISPNTALFLYLPDVAELDEVDSFAIGKRFGNAIVVTDNAEASIVGIVNEDNRGNTSHNDGNPIPEERIGQGSTYSAIPAGSETVQLFFPQVMNNVDGIFSGGFFFSNISGQAGFCEIHFTGVPEAKIDDFDMAVNESKSYYAPNIANLPDGFNSSVRVHCNVEVIGIQNFAADPGTGKVGDSFTQNNGFNK
ncbi:MAG: hypothetical protein ISR58_15565 [Anaerolineales bacterium]|nr:hypothetical protein [Chloroflexota bacterium]MBL6982590.1 hypothetical protein [Anaerolineales bacterium]